MKPTKTEAGLQARLGEIMDWLYKNVATSINPSLRFRKSPSPQHINLPGPKLPRTVSQSDFDLHQLPRNE